MAQHDDPYAEHMAFLHPPLERIDVPALVAECTDARYTQTLCKVNESVVRLGVLQGEDHWHKLDRDDAFFFVLDGLLIIDIQDGESIELRPRQGSIVPRGVIHRTRAPVKTVVLMIEDDGVIPSADNRGLAQEELDP